MIAYCALLSNTFAGEDYRRLAVSKAIGSLDQKETPGKRTAQMPRLYDERSQNWPPPGS